MGTSISVLGSGSWGTALAIHLAKKGYDVKIWGRNSALLEEMASSRQNKKYLPNGMLPDNVLVTPDILECVNGTEVVVLSVASQGVRDTIKMIKYDISKDAIIINTAKGIEKDTLMTLSQITKEELPNNTFVALSGPSHAEEVSKSLPTTLVSSSECKKTAEYVQDLFMTPNLRVYTNPDVIGVELGGALKNIIALAAGISDGLGFGDNAKAALMTRGIAEISRLGIEMGAQPATFSGLSGIGDLIVTCTSMHSRNRRCGILIGKGVSLNQAVQEIGMVVESIYTINAAYKLSEKYDVEMPITKELYHVLNDNTNVREAVVNLMTRQRKHEMEETSINFSWKY